MDRIASHRTALPRPRWFAFHPSYAPTTFRIPTSRAFFRRYVQPGYPFFCVTPGNTFSLLGNFYARNTSRSRETGTFTNGRRIARSVAAEILKHSNTRTVSEIPWIGRCVLVTETISLSLAFLSFFSPTSVGVALARPAT